MKKCEYFRRLVKNKYCFYDIAKGHGCETGKDMHKTGKRFIILDLRRDSEQKNEIFKNRYCPNENAKDRFMVSISTFLDVNKEGLLPVGIYMRNKYTSV